MSIPIALATPLAERAFISALDLFKVGIGPSSSHTVGPLRAARAFVDGLGDRLEQVASVECVLFGSLGSTGVGHGTPGAVLAGLSGLSVETVTRDDVERVVADADRGMLRLGGTHPLALTPTVAAVPGTLRATGPSEPAAPDGSWLRFAPRELKPRHPNALTLTARDASGAVLADETYYSVGGGFVERDGDEGGAAGEITVPFRFDTADELLRLCREHGLSIAQLARANEAAVRGEAATSAALRAIARAMDDCIDAGLSSTGILPGGLRVPRRAAAMAENLRALDAKAERDCSLEWLQAYAIAVNEENAAGGRVVTAPTNGAAGIIPAVMRHALDVIRVPDPDAAREEFLLVAAVVGGLIKSNASISGAEAGCQGEVGSAASMAAAGFVHLLGGSNEQIENAAEIAMEHSLGLTCDPVAGLVQMPCIERNAIGAGKAVAAARMAMHGDGTHLISFDTVVQTMRQTGDDMSRKYKETSEGGLAVNYVEC
ncbi:L-serine ammonia-lyase [Microcella sp.]|uniref:L-serine ammonia-lyase n=1 Tax=Microcella sp. TaxID=1913979 RepID=UPI003918BE77